MEYGEMTTLFSQGNKEEIKEIAKEKVAQKTWIAEKNNWVVSESDDLMSEEESLELNRQFNRELGLILRGSRAVEQVGNISEKAEVARETSLEYKGVKVVSLAGQETDLSEYLGNDIARKAWEFEPHPDFEKSAYMEMLTGMQGHEVERTNEERLWQIMNESLAKLNEKERRSIDIKNLTPYQAVWLINETIRERMSYEELITSGAKNETVKEKVLAGEIKTSNPEIWKIEDGKEKRKQTRELRIKIDKMSPDQLLDFRFGTCRHIAESTQAMYELLKKRQEGLLMNGSYLIYHDEDEGEQKNKSSVNYHAYNVLYVTSPKDNGEQDVSVSVLDPTWSLSGKEDVDRTYERMSQAISSLYEYGKKLGIEDVPGTCRELAGLAARRLEYFMLTNRTANYFDDYASLLIQEDLSKHKILNNLEDVYFASDVRTINFLNRLFEVPALVAERNKKAFILKDSWIKPVMEKVAHYNFDTIFHRLESDILETKLNWNVAEIESNVIDRIANNSYSGNFGQREIDFGRLILANQCLRVNFERQRIPPEETWATLYLLAEADKKGSWGIINQEWVAKLKKQIDEDEKNSPTEVESTPGTKDDRA